MEKELSYITGLIGEPVRTKILWTLLDDRAYTASELAACTDTSAQNISMHLSKLVDAELLAVETQGRHKYYRFSKPEVAYVIEALGNLLPSPKHKKIIDDKENVSIRHCRTCYDHLAGKIGVALTDALLKQYLITPAAEGYEVTKSGISFFSHLGINVNKLQGLRRQFARPCLDWSERKHHLAGAVGAGLLEAFLRSDYVRRKKNSRALIITSSGEKFLFSRFKISV